MERCTSASSWSFLSVSLCEREENEECAREETDSVTMPPRSTRVQPQQQLVAQEVYTAQLPEWKAAKRRGEVYIDEAISTSTNSVLTILEKHTPKNCVCVYSTLYFGLPFYFNYFDFFGCRP